jgi:hypothetical protein
MVKIWRKYRRNRINKNKNKHILIKTTGVMKLAISVPVLVKKDQNGFKAY